MVEVGDPATKPGAGRPDVLAYPSPTTSRYLVFAAALLSAGLFVGGWVHNQTVGQEWADTYLDCRAKNGATVPAFSPESYDAQEGVRRCIADVEWTRALITLGGAGLAALIALVILVVAPVVVRRRRGLRELDSRLGGANDRVRLLADEAGVGSRVRPMLGRTTQRDAFSFGRPGRYVVVLPPAAAVRWRDESLFDPLVSHELAHVRHGDVALAWLTRSVGIGLAPLLAAPIVVGLVTGEPSLLPGYTWRAALLGLVVVLVSAALLRSREHDADLRAARLRGGPSAMTRVLDLTADRPATWRSWRSWSLLANHPRPQERRDILDDPAKAAGTGFVDGFTAAFLVGLALPLVVAAVSPVAAQLGDSNASYVVAAALLGPLLAGSVGLGAWRMALFERLAGTTVPAWRLAAGVGVGLVLGKAASLQQTAAGLTGLRSPAWLLVIGLAGAGATLLSSGLGHLWADAAPRVRGVRVSWWVALLVNALLFTTLLWAAELFVFAADNGGWVFARAGLVLTLSTWQVALVVLGLAGFALVALVLGRGASATAPAWLMEDGEPAAWPQVARPSPGLVVTSGLAAGLVAVGAIVAFRLAQGEAVTADEIYGRVLTFEWLSGLVAATCVLVIAVAYPGWGAGGGWLAGMVATSVVTAGFLTLNRVADGRFNTDMIRAFAVPALGLALFLGVVALPLAGSAARLPDRRPTRVALVALLCTVVVAVGAAELPARAHLVGTHPATDLLEGATPRQPADPEEAGRREVLTYAQDVAPGLYQQAQRLRKTLNRILGDDGLSAAVRAERIDVEVLGPLRDLLDDALAYDAVSAELDGVHQEAVAALRTAVEQAGVIIEYLRTGEQQLVDHALELRDEEDEHWGRWVEQLGRLVDDATA